MLELLNLGEMYISDFIKDESDARGGKHELKLILDPIVNAPRIESPAKRENLFGKYWYYQKKQDIKDM